MEVRELRIGNYIQTHEITESFLPRVKEIYDSGKIVATSVFEGITLHTYISGIEGITLTEEWFLKFGAEEKPLDWFYFQGFAACLYPETKTIKVAIHQTEETYILNCEYVHHFQNLIYDIVHQELTIKE